MYFVNYILVYIVKARSFPTRPVTPNNICSSLSLNQTTQFNISYSATLQTTITINNLSLSVEVTQNTTPILSTSN